MTKGILKYSLFIILFLPQFLLSQDMEEKEESKPLTRILFVFDASQSMYGRWQSDLKINTANRILSRVLDSLSSVENLELGLRLYGHQFLYPPPVCTDTKLEVPLGKNNVEQIKHKLKSINPKGTTPIAYALEQAGGDFPPCDNCRNIIVLITDGIEECGGDPCAVSEELQKRGLVLKPFIIGIGKNFEDAFGCVGDYYDASNEDQFSKSLNIVITRALNPTSAQVNLLDENGNPSETNVNMTFFDHVSALVKYNYIHTMNHKGNPDTLQIDPLSIYDIVINTIPPVIKDSVVLIPGKHNIIAFNTPQGELQIDFESNASFIKAPTFIIKKLGEGEILNIQLMGGKEKYLTGYYDIELLTLPRILLKKVEISQSHLTTIKIPNPGIAVISKTVRGFGSLYVEKENGQEWVCNFRDEISNQENLVLQPGKYTAIFRSINARQSFYTIEKKFEIRSGITTNVKFYTN